MAENADAFFVLGIFFILYSVRLRRYWGVAKR